MIKRISISAGIFVLLALLTSTIIGCCTFSGPNYMGEKSDHFDGEQFHNLQPIEQHGLWDLVKWNLNRDRGYWEDWIPDSPGPPPPERVGMGELLITFIGHSTVLVQADSINMLTDPIWSDRASPVDGFGPHRKRPPGIRFEDLPPIDLVMVSHNHYDHLDLHTLEMLRKDHDPKFRVPLGNRALLEENDINRVEEMDWWDSIPFRHMDIHLVPAQHFAMRGTCDRNTTLWGGFVMMTEGGPVYFAGDTGYGPHFKMINERFGPMRFSMLPIGAYRPRWFMKPVHTSPAEAVDAHIDVESRKSMGIHFGTFIQADDGRLESIIDLKDALYEKKIDFGEFILPRHGKGVMIAPLGESRKTAESAKNTE